MQKSAGVATVAVVFGVAMGIASTAAAQSAPAFVKGFGNYSHIVANLDRSLAFYRDGLGLELTGPAPVFRPDPVIMKLANVPGAQTRYTWLKVPGSTMAVELIEYKDIERTAASPRFQDPGATTLSVRVRELDETIARLKRLGGRVITVSGAPADIGGRARIVFMQDPDGFVIELAQSLATSTGVPAAPPAAPDPPGNVLGASLELGHGQDDRLLPRSPGADADGGRVVQH